MIHVGGDNMSDRPKLLGSGGHTLCVRRDLIPNRSRWRCLFQLRERAVQAPDYRGQITGCGQMMLCQRIADPLQLIQRGFQRPLLDTALAHHIAQQGDANIPNLRQRIGTRFPRAKLPDHVRAVQQHHAPARSSQRRDRSPAVIQLTDVMIDQRFILVSPRCGLRLELVDKTLCVTPDMAPAALCVHRAGT